MAIRSLRNATRLILWFALLADLSSATTSGEDLCGGYECSVAIYSDAFARCWVQDDNQIIDYVRPVDGGHHRIPNACRRSNIFGGDGYVVAYPSTGGLVFLKSPSAVDLQHLGLPNTCDSARSPDEDDDIATRMVQLGAQWWPNWDLYFRHSSRIANAYIFYDYHFPSKVDVAYPATGGAWVANFTQDDIRYKYEEMYGDADCQAWLPYLPDPWRIKMRYVLTMDDKAAVMKELGATFYDSVDDIPGLAKTVEEAVVFFEPFRQRLKKMENDVYRRRFCSGEDEHGDSDTATDPDTGSQEPQKPRWGAASLASLFYQIL